MNSDKRPSVTGNLRLLHSIFKLFHLYYYLAIYLIFFFFVAFILSLTEPGIPNFGDGIWYCFSIATTTGLGDLTVVTTGGKILTIILGIVSLFVVALFTAVVVNFFREKQKARLNESVIQFKEQLEHLDELSKEELAALSERVRNFRSKQ